MKAVFFLTFIASALVAAAGHVYDPTDFGFGETLRG